MSQGKARFGLSAAISTPFDAAMRPDTRRLVAHAKALLADGCDSITLFGTTGEGASLGEGERGLMLHACKDAGFDYRSQVLVGIAVPAVETAIAQSKLALDMGCRGLLIAPPFYFKGASDDALFAWHAEYFNGLGPAARDVFLYHLPSVTAVPLSVDLVGRLKTAFPNAVAGVKDSSGSWVNTQALLAAHRELLILVGDERQLAQAVREGGSGAICGMANLEPAKMARLINRAEDDSSIRALVDAIVKLPVMAAVKALIAHRRRDPQWAAMRPPLEALDAGQTASVVASYESIMDAKVA